MLSQEQLKSHLHYDPETGVFTRLKAGVRAQRFIGKAAGCTCGTTGYHKINVGGRLYAAHRLAFLYMTGEMPLGEVDHINHAKSDNRWKNLRDVHVSVNQQNRIDPQANNISGLLGVSIYRAGDWIRWRARIKADGRDRTIGYYESPEAAHAAYLIAKRHLHAGCTI